MCFKMDLGEEYTPEPEPDLAFKEKVRGRQSSRIVVAAKAPAPNVIQKLKTQVGVLCWGWSIGVLLRMESPFQARGRQSDHTVHPAISSLTIPSPPAMPQSNYMYFFPNLK